MRILLVTDAWAPQVNGVVRTLQAVRERIVAQGHIVPVLSPDLFASLPCPTYPEIRLALARERRVAAHIAAAAPDAIHIATEGPLGVAARRWCLARGVPFTTAYHTQFPDYLAQRTRLPAALFWRYIRWFHAPASAILVSTQTMARTLAAHGLPRSRHWGRGVNLAQFGPAVAPDPHIAALPGPVLLYVGRISVEKNVAAFLDCAHPGSKVVVGDGPARADLERRYRQALFTGALHGPALAAAYVAADVFVFPSRTDTFGLVMIEALACGTPVAALPVPGPIDVLTPAVAALDSDLDTAIAAALTRDRATCAAYARRFDWSESAAQFLAALTPIGSGARLTA